MAAPAAPRTSRAHTRVNTRSLRLRGTTFATAAITFYHFLSPPILSEAKGMTMKRVLVVGLAMAWAAAPAMGQEATQDSGDLLRAIMLPAVSEQLRRSGIAPEEVKAAVNGAKEKGVSAGAITEVLRETARSVEENGPIDNFGAFVQSQLDAGLRGRELAAAIHAEHARRGIGKGKSQESRGRGRARGRNQAEPAAAEAGPRRIPDWLHDVASVVIAIESQPGAANSILGEHGLTRTAFEAMIYEVAADPELTAAYEEARKQ